MVEQRSQHQQDGDRQQGAEHAPDPGEIGQRDQDQHRVHGEARAKDRRGDEIGFDRVQRQIGGRRDEAQHHCIGGADAEQAEQRDHHDRSDIGQEIEQRRQPAPHDRGIDPKRPGAQRHDHADHGIDRPHREDIGGDPVLHFADHARGLDAGAEAGAAEQQPLAQPHARLDHEIGHQQRQDRLEDQARRGKGHLFEQAGCGQHHFAGAVTVHQRGELFVERGDPGEALAQFAEARHHALRHCRHVVEQRDGRLQDQRQREQQDGEEEQERRERGERIGQAPAVELVGQRRKDHRQHQRGNHWQEHHRTDRQHEGQGEEQAQPDQQHQRGDQPQFLFGEGVPARPAARRR